MLGDEKGAETGGGVSTSPFQTLAEHLAEVRQLLLLSSMNIGLHEGVKALAVQGGELYRKHTYAGPALGTGHSMVTPTLTNWGTATSLASRGAQRTGSRMQRPRAR